MARGGARLGAGKPRRIPAAASVAPDTSIAVRRRGETPLAYMLRVMRDPAADQTLRMRAAIAAAPFVHARAEAPGKKADAREAAGRAGTGRLETPPTPPKLIVNNQ